MLSKNKKYLVALIVIFSLAGCLESSKRQSEIPLATVSYVDLNRYQGVWYEIARFPFSVQDGCFASQATYTKLSDSSISVFNKCYLQSLEGKEYVAEGRAVVADSKTQAKLKVNFNFFMKLFGGGNYWIIDLAPDYSYSVVSEPKGRYLWILSRSREMSESTYSQIISRLKADGFQIEYLEKTIQPKSL